PFFYIKTDKQRHNPFRMFRSALSNRVIRDYLNLARSSLKFRKEIAESRIKSGEIFLSYSSTDRAIVSQVQIRLAEEGFSIWHDIVSLTPGDRWNNEIENGLDQSSVMLLFLSSSSIQSTYVEQEYDFFLDRGKHMIPVILE